MWVMLCSSKSYDHKSSFHNNWDYYQHYLIISIGVSHTKWIGLSDFTVTYSYLALVLSCFVFVVVIYPLLWSPSSRSCLNAVFVPCFDPPTPFIFVFRCCFCLCSFWPSMWLCNYSFLCWFYFWRCFFLLSSSLVTFSASLVYCIILFSFNNFVSFLYPLFLCGRIHINCLKIVFIFYCFFSPFLFCTCLCSFSFHFFSIISLTLHLQYLLPFSFSFSLYYLF